MPRSQALSVVNVPIDSALAILRAWRTDDPTIAEDPTLSPEWLGTWWRCFGERGSDRVLSLVSEGQTVGLLFTRHEVHRYYKLPVRTVCCWVNSHAQRAGLFLRCDPDAAARALAQYWVQTAAKWDLLRLQGLPEEQFARALMQHLSELRCPCVSVRTWAHSRLAIDRSWEDYFRGVVSTETRRQVERQKRRLADLGRATWCNHESAESAALALDDFVKVEAQSWKRLAGERIASEPLLLAFYSDVIRSFAERGEACATVLYLDDSPICAGLNLLANGRLLTLKTSFDERFAKYSPGSQLFRQLIAHAFSRGFKEIDFYGKMPFSQRWTKDERCFIDLQVQSPTMRSHLIGLARAARKWWGAARQEEKAGTT